MVEKFVLELTDTEALRARSQDVIVSALKPHALWSLNAAAIYIACNTNADGLDAIHILTATMAIKRVLQEDA